MYITLLTFHSLLRYVIILFLVIAIAKSFNGWLNKKDYINSDDKMSLFAFIFAHIQLLLGLALYFISPFVQQGFEEFPASMGNSTLRFWMVEHIFMMFLGIATITFSRIKAKKAVLAITKHKITAIGFTIGLLLILVSIPWPIGNVMRPLFRFF
jgi:hypothetical protein